MPESAVPKPYDKAMTILKVAVAVLAAVGVAVWVWAGLVPAGHSSALALSLEFEGFDPPAGGERLQHWTVGNRVSGLSQVNSFDVPTGPESMLMLPDGRLLVACRMAKVVAILDPETGEIDGQIPLEGRPLASCLTRNGTRAWVTLEDQSRVAVIDLESMTRVAEAPTGRSPEAIAAHPDDEVVAIANWNSRDLTLLDGGRAEVVGTVPLPSYPRGVVVHPTKPFVMVSITGSDRLVKVNWRKQQIEDELIVGRGPRHMVQASDGDTLYVALNSPPTIAKVDRPAGRVRSTCFLSKGRAGTILLGPNERDLFVANAMGSFVTVIDTDIMKETATVESDLAPDGMALSEDGRRLYVAHRNTAVVEEYAVEYVRERAAAAQEAP